MESPQNALMRNQSYMDSAVRAVTHKRPIPEIDFTLHTMEDGTQVSTQDRVCKGTFDTRINHSQNLLGICLLII